MKKPLIILLILAAAGTAFALFAWHRNEPVRGYRFVEVERGDLESTVDATGNLSAVSTVAVGTQVSGRILAIYADYNGRVKAGQLIAQLDPVLLEQTVIEAQASLARRRADLERLERDFSRSERLYKEQLLSESDYNIVQFSVAAAKADVTSATASLARARQNLAYTEIYSPINGVVIERNVEEGQTVAASLSAPQLFLIAEDLSQMQIQVAVDESDIGRIVKGQTVRFTVQAYPDDSFFGTVEQVRLQSAVQENVVTYTVVVAVRNTDGRLLPGMTATVEFLVETAKDVLKVANAALRFRPTPEMLAELREQREDANEEGETRQGPRSGGEGERTRGGGRPDGDGAPREGRRSGENASARLWTLDAAGKLEVIPVRTGITDGQSTAIEGEGIEPGTRVIAGVSQDETKTPASPFQQPQQQGGRPRPGGF